MNPGRKRRRTTNRKRRKQRGPLRPFDDLLRMILDAAFGFGPVVQAGPQVSPIPSDLYRKLLMLCHPDKHGNSETSTEVTRWLIQNDPRRKR